METTHTRPRLSAEPPRTLSLDRGADTLALVRRVFGCLPRSSLVVIGLQSGTTGGHMRVDLPRSGEDPVGYARRAAECIAGPDARPQPQAAVLLLFVQEEPHPGWAADRSARPFARLLEALSLIFEAEYGVEVPKIWAVGGGKMRDYECPESSCCPYPGEDTASLLAEAEARYSWLREPEDSSGSVSFNDPAAQVRGFESGGLRDPEFLRAVSDHRARLSDQRGDDGAAAHALLTSWDSALEITAETGSVDWLTARPEVVAELMIAAGHTGMRDTLIPLAAEGFVTALCGYLGHRAAAEPGDDLVSAAQVLRGPPGQQIPDGLASPEVLEDVLQSYRLSFLGRTGRRPDWRRMDALTDLLSALAGCAEGEPLTHLMVLMAWVEWARGRGSCAGAFIDRCRELAPEDELIRLIEQYMVLGGICPWARVKVHSWSWWWSSAAGASGSDPHDRSSEENSEKISKDRE